MTRLQIGAESMRIYSAELSKQLQRTVERYGLDTAETAALMLWVSSVTANHLQSISELRATLMNGLRDLESTMNNKPLQDALMVAIMQSEPHVRGAAIIRRPNKPAKATIYLQR